MFLAAAASLALVFVLPAWAVAPSVTLSAPANGSATNSTTPTFSGTAGTALGDSDVTVKVYSGPDTSGMLVQTLGPAPRDAGGNWSVPANPALAEGTYTAQAEQSNGLDTGTSSANTFRMDTAAPAVTLAAPANGSATNNAAPTFSGAAGTATGDSSTVTVKVYAGTDTSGALVQTLTATASAGSWSVPASPALAQGTYTAQAEQSDDAGNTDTSSANTFSVDTAAPAVTLTAPAHASTTFATPTFSGAAGTATGDSPTVTVKIYRGTNVFGTLVQTRTVTASGGSWSVSADPALAQDTYTAQAEQSDDAGNTGKSSANTFTTIGPPITLTAPANGSVTNNPTPTFSGAAGTGVMDSDVTVKVYSGSDTSGTLVQTLGPAAPDGGGNWSVPASPALAQGTYTAQAEQSDGANTGKSTANTFRVDTTAPAVALSAPTNGSSTNDTTPPMYGGAGAALGDSSTVTVKVYSGSGIAGSPVIAVNADGSSGVWLVTIPFAPGTYTVQAQQADSAGNTGFSAAHTFTVDTGAPDTTITSAPSGTVRSTNATFNFAATEAASFQCRLDGGPFTPCASPATYSNLAQGSHTFEVRATDGVGNTDPSSAIASWQVDTSTPQLALLRPFPIVRLAGRLTRNGVALSAFEVVAPPGSRIQVTCRGRSCPLHRSTKIASIRASSARAVAQLAKRVRFTRFGRLRAGVVIEVRITKARTIGKYTRFRIRKGKLPARTDACLMPGKTKPTRCPT